LFITTTKHSIIFVLHSTSSILNVCCVYLGGLRCYFFSHCYIYQLDCYSTRFFSRQLKFLKNWRKL